MSIAKARKSADDADQFNFAAVSDYAAFLIFSSTVSPMRHTGSQHDGSVSLPPCGANVCTHLCNHHTSWRVSFFPSHLGEGGAHCFCNGRVREHRSQLIGHGIPSSSRRKKGRWAPSSPKGEEKKASHARKKCVTPSPQGGGGRKVRNCTLALPHAQLLLQAGA